MRKIKFLIFNEYTKKIESVGELKTFYNNGEYGYAEPKLGIRAGDITTGRYGYEIEVNWKKLMFTGKYDTHGDEIYEGHILKYENPNHPNHKPYVIRWAEEDCCFECVNSSNFMLPSVWGEMEIIGNVFENPELLKEDK